ncbi:thiol:disulfide interchange protein [Pelistega indica]|uniref:Thiol:disulfide interchange protein n=1 Tax=Pelistega indica TaxID=1414851 RepID=V8G301_9BURK|nr:MULTISPECIES: thiol:disulfide interchange protein DsbA/DsbL [Pelistega]ETD70037.1 thiol:disulfide interchange protein [Pelistega indica]
MLTLKTLKTLIPALGFVALSTFSTAQAQEKYITFNPAFASQTPAKTEVLEFFSYACSHCAAMEPMVENLSKELPASAELLPVPVAFNASMEPMQRLFYTLMALDRKDLHPKVFEAIHKDKKRLFTRDVIVDWAVSQGIDKKTFEETYDSFGVNTKVRRATEMTDQYKVDATPSFAVAGKYLTSPGMTGDYESAIVLVKQLVEKEAK